METTPLVVPFFDQLAVTVAAYGMKPLYMLLAGTMAYRMRKSTSQDLRYLMIGLISFFAGEMICAVNYLSTGSLNDPLEILHGLGMVGAGIFIPWSFFIFMDERVLHLSSEDRRCGFLPFCGRCGKKDESGCGMKRVIRYTIPGFILVALIPLTRPLEPYMHTIVIFKSNVLFPSTHALQYSEFIVYPVISALLFAASGMALLKTDDMSSWARFFFPGLGFMTFSFFRFVLTYAFLPSPVWSNIWEEVTELLAILFIALILRIFREQLLVNH